MPTDKKVQAVDHFKKKLENAQGIVLTDFSGLGVESCNRLRRYCRKGDTEFFVIKNTLARLAVREVGLEGLEQFLAGPTGWAITTSDPIAPAKIISEFAREHKLPKVKGAFIDGTVLTADRVSEVASLPSKAILVSQVLGLLQSPIQRIAGTLHAVMTSLAVGLDEIRKQKEAGSTQPASSDDAPAGSERATGKREEQEEQEEQENPQKP